MSDSLHVMLVVRPEDRQTVIEVAGPLDSRAVERLRSVAEATAAAALTSDRHVVLDLRGVTSVAPHLLAVLVAARNWLRERLSVRCSPAAAAAVDAAGLARLLPLDDAARTARPAPPVSPGR